MEDDSSEALFFPENPNNKCSSNETKPASIFNPAAPTFSPFNASNQQSPTPATGIFGQPSGFPTNGLSTSTNAPSTAFAFPRAPNQPTTSAAAPSVGQPIAPAPFSFGKTAEPAPITSANDTAPTATPSPFGDFKFGESASESSSKAGGTFCQAPTTNSPFNFGTPSTTPTATQSSFFPGQGQTVTSWTESAPFAPSTFGQPANVQQEQEEKERSSDTGKLSVSLQSWQMSLHIKVVFICIWCHQHDAFAFFFIIPQWLLRTVQLLRGLASASMLQHLHVIIATRVR